MVGEVKVEVWELCQKAGREWFALKYQKGDSKKQEEAGSVLVEFKFIEIEEIPKKKEEPPKKPEPSPSPPILAPIVVV